MKPLFLLLTIVVTITTYAQNPLSQKVQNEIGIGISLPTLNGGTELIRAKSLRKNGLSYYQSSDGSRKSVGNYGGLIGASVSTAFYIPVKKVKGLMIGSVFRLSLTSSEPSGDGYAEGYFFNFSSLGLAFKYYPFTANNLFLKADGGIGTVLTKNRYVNDAGKQQYFHQFGVGTNGSISIGYSLTPIKNKNKTIDFTGTYQLNNIRVEVNDVGNDTWKYTALGASISINL